MECECWNWTTSSLDFGGCLLTLDTAENKAFLAGAVKVGGNDPKVEMASVSKATFTRPNDPISIEDN